MRFIQFCNKVVFCLSIYNEQLMYEHYNYFMPIVKLYISNKIIFSSNRIVHLSCSHCCVHDPYRTSTQLAINNFKIISDRIDFDIYTKEIIHAVCFLQCIGSFHQYVQTYSLCMQHLGNLHHSPVHRYHSQGRMGFPSQHSFHYISPSILLHRGLGHILKN